MVEKQAYSTLTIQNNIFDVLRVSEHANVRFTNYLIFNSHELSSYYTAIPILGHQTVRFGPFKMACFFIKFVAGFSPNQTPTQNSR